MEMSNSKRDDAEKQREMIKDRREKRFSTGMIKYFREYCRNTSIHGFKYLSERRTACERLWWIISILISLSVCVALVVKTYYKWQSSPVIVTFATKETPAWQVPFPAVTICPEAKSIPSKFNYTKYWMKKQTGERLPPDKNSGDNEDENPPRLRAPRWFRKHLDPLQIPDRNLIRHYCFLQIEIIKISREICDMVQDQMESVTEIISHIITLINKVLVCFRFTASGSFQDVIGDTLCISVSQPLADTWVMAREAENQIRIQLEELDMYRIRKEVKPDFFESLGFCSFMGVPYEECRMIFFPVVTDEGLCYTFNLLDRSQIYRENVLHYKDWHKASRLSNWSLDHGYDINDDIVTYPQRALFAGTSWSLEGVLSVNEDDMDYQCRDGIQGFKIQIAHPSKMPRTLEHHFRVPLDSIIQVAVSPDIIVTSKTVKKYDPHIRNCYFSNERQLKYFKIYTQENCQIECTTNYTYNQCGCMDFYMPKEHDTPVCGQGQVHCLYDAEWDLMDTIIKRKLNYIRGQTSVSKDELFDGCDCLPVCNSMKYNVELSTAPWPWRNIREFNNSSSPQSKKIHKSYFQIFFKSNQFMASERNELYGVTTFLANFGGLLGLFTGFSLLSLIEIIYYLTLRILKNKSLYGRWTGIDIRD